MGETPELDKFYRENKDQVNFLLLAVQDSETAVKKVLESKKASLPVLMDSGKIASSYRVSGVPAARAIGADGSLVGSKVGSVSAADLKKLVEQAQ